MDEIKVFIPARLKNVAKNGHVAGTEDIYDDELQKTQKEINAEQEGSIAAEVERATGIEELLQSEVNALSNQNYVSVDSYSELPSLGSVDTVYRVGSWDGTQVDPTKYAEYAWNNTGIDQGEYKLLDVKNYGIDDEPTAGSENLVKSGGIAEKYGDYVENPEFIEAHTDAEDKVLYGVKADGDFYFGAGVPRQVQKKIDAKVDKIPGKGLSTNDYDNTAKDVVDTNELVENLEFIQITTDSEDNILEGITSEGKKQINIPIDTPSVIIDYVENPEWMEVITDSNGNILEGRKYDGTKVENTNIVYPNGIPSEIKKYIEKHAGGINIGVSLPNKFYGVIGDTLQLFYRGIVKSKFPYQYDLLPVSSVGKMLPRYYELIPNVAGSFNFSLYVKNDNGNVLGSKSCQIQVVSPTQPVNTINVACFGDSLTSSGAWCVEAHRRLTGIGGAPAGLQFNNINFVGKKFVNGVGYYGEGGWSWKDYTTEGRTAFRFFVASNINVSRGSVYTDGTDNYTISEVNLTSDTPNILGNAPYGTQHTPSGNTLTKISGAGDATITFTNYSNASQNPLWNYDESKIDFQMYADNYCNGTIDVVYTLLSWNGQNNWRTDFTNVITEIKKFADALHSDFPNAKMKLMGVPCPDVHGGEGNVEGATGINYADQYGIFITALNQNDAYQEFANREEYKDFVEFVNISAQFDVEYNMPTTQKQVNTRCSTTEAIGTNDVHPNTDGYMQIADAVFRNFVGNFCN